MLKSGKADWSLFCEQKRNDHGSGTVFQQEDWVAAQLWFHGILWLVLKSFHLKHYLQQRGY